MTPAQECAQHIAVLVAGLDSKLNELATLLPDEFRAWYAICMAHDALTRVLAETNAAVEVGR